MLLLKSAPDYENPTDTGTNNSYEVKVRATDSSNNTSDQTLTVNIANVDDSNTTTESKGSVSLLKDSSGKAYIQLSGGPLVKILNDRNQHVGDKSYSGWTLIGAETVSGLNQLVWKNTNGSFYRWDMNSQWKQTTGKFISGDLLNRTEESFSQDLNSDGTVGSSPIITGPSGTAGSSSSSKSINENTTTVHTFSANETVTWSLNVVLMLPNLI